MGKGDKKTKRGKIIKGSYGVTRPRKVRKGAPAVVEEKPKAKAKAPVKEVAKAAEPKPKAVKKPKEKVQKEEPVVKAETAEPTENVKEKTDKPAEPEGE